MNKTLFDFGVDTSPCPMPWWLPGGHTQTVYAAIFARTPECLYSRIRVSTPDDDFIDLDWTGCLINTNKALDPHAPITHERTKALVLFHGLEGSSQSHYALAIASYFSQAGWLVCVPNFRGCSGQVNKLPRAYHSGDSAECQFILSQVKHFAPNAQWHAAGVSMGGNILLKHLGETESAALHACAAISTPVDLFVAGQALCKGLNHWLYDQVFLRTLKAKALEKVSRYPGSLNIEAIRQARDLYEFDNIYTAPTHGYRDTVDYWTSASSKPLLRNIKTPTLILNARNDPFYPAHALPTKQEVSEFVTLHQPSEGGHVGFMDQNANLSWLPRRLEEFFLKGK